MIENTIIVNTCDAYEDVWELFFRAFEEYWPGCRYKIVLNTERKQRNIAGNSSVHIHNFYSSIGYDMWGLRLKQTLNACDSEYVLMLYDDFILEDFVNQTKITNCINWLNDNLDVVVFYFTNIAVNRNVDDVRFEGFELIPKRGDYKLNSAPAIWRRKVLLKYIEDYDNPWAWEFFGSYRTYGSADLFYCAKKEHENIYPYNYAMGGAIYRGKWVGQIVLPLIEKYNLHINVSERGLVDEVQKNSNRSLRWKVDFLLLGFRMINFGVFLYIYRILKKRLLA
jgi:hypothetical protein